MKRFFCTKTSFLKSSFTKSCLTSSLQSRFFSAPLPAHIDTPDNTIDTIFDFTNEEYDEIDRILSKYPTNYKQSATIPLLYIAQSHCGVSYIQNIQKIYFL